MCVCLCLWVCVCGGWSGPGVTGSCRAARQRPDLASSSVGGAQTHHPVVFAYEPLARGYPNWKCSGWADGRTVGGSLRPESCLSWACRTTDAKLTQTTTSQSLEASFPLVDTVACAATPCTPECPELTGYAMVGRLLYYRYIASPIEGSTIALIPGRVSAA